MDELRPPEAHFDLRGMHVHVHFIVGHLEKQQRGRKNSRRQNIAISLVNGVQDQTVAHQSAIHKYINPVSIRPLYIRPRSKSRNRERRRLFTGFHFRFRNCRTEWRGSRRDLQQFIQRLLAKQLVDAVRQSFPLARS